MPGVRTGLVSVQYVAVVDEEECPRQLLEFKECSYVQAWAGGGEVEVA